MRTSPRTVISSNPRRLLILAVAATSLSSAAFAQTTISWIGTTGNYVDGTNWSNGLTPTNAANTFLVINNAGTANINPGDAAEGAYLTLGLNSGDNGSLNITGGTLTTGELRVGGRETLPDFTVTPIAFTPTTSSGTGSVVQSGSSVVNVTFDEGSYTGAPVQSLYIGDSGLASGSGAVGSYTIKNTASLLSGIATDDAIVVGTGGGTQATFLQQDSSTVTSTGFVTVGKAGGTASYTLTGGTLNVGNPAVPAVGTMNLTIGDAAALDVTTNFVPGTTGTFTQSGSLTTVNVKNNLTIGSRDGTGLYTMSAGTLAVTGQIIVGNGASSLFNSTGTYNLSGGTVTIGTNLNVGLSSSTVSNSDVGNFNMTGGSITFNAANSVLAVGNGFGTTGNAHVSAGTITLNGATAMLDIGRTNGNGLFDISGTANVSVNELLLNSATANLTANRELRIEGGTLNVAFWEQGSANTPAVRTVNMTGGIFNVTSATAAHRGGRNVLYNFSGGVATFAGNMPFDTSTLTISNTANVTFNNLRTQSATVNVNGGSLTAVNVNDSGNQAGNTTLSAGTVNVTGAWNVTSATPATPGTLTISGGAVSINTLTTGGSATLNSALNISGGTLNIPSLNLSTGSTLKTDNAISLSSSFNLGTATINVNSGSLALTGPFAINASGGRTLTKTGSGPLTVSGAQSYVAGSIITNSAGTLNLNSPTTDANLTLNANSATNLNSPQSLSSLNVADSVTTSVAPAGTNSLTLSSLNLNSTGTLDLANNPLTLNYSSDPISTLVTYLHSAYNNGSWTGPGLTSSTAQHQPNHITGIGYSDTNSQIITKYTYLGDLNLDGRINADDYALLDRQVAKNGLGSPATWTTGDFNYDGVVTSADYMLIDTSFAHQSGTLSPTFLAQRESEFGSTYVSQLIAAVPEPSLFAACGLALLLPRRRPNKK